MKKKIYIIATVAVTLFLSACSGGGGTSEGGGANQITITTCSTPSTGTITCGSGTIPNNYTCIESGDTLVKVDSNTTVQIVQNPNSKMVCIDSGSAYLLR